MGHSTDQACDCPDPVAHIPFAGDFLYSASLRMVASSAGSKTDLAMLTLGVDRTTTGSAPFRAKKPCRQGGSLNKIILLL